MKKNSLFYQAFQARMMERALWGKLHITNNLSEANYEPTENRS